MWKLILKEELLCGRHTHPSDNSGGHWSYLILSKMEYALKCIRSRPESLKKPIQASCHHILASLLRVHGRGWCHLLDFARDSCCPPTALERNFASFSHYAEHGTLGSVDIHLTWLWAFVTDWVVREKPLKLLGNWLNIVTHYVEKNGITVMMSSVMWLETCGTFMVESVCTWMHLGFFIVYKNVIFSSPWL